MEVALLGPLQVTDEGSPVAVRSGKARALLALLALDAGRPHSVDRLVDGLWGDDLPANPRNAVQVLVSKLRRDVGPDRVVLDDAGYTLALSRDAVDALRFAELTREAQQRATGDPAAALAPADAALALWRGEPLAELGDEPFIAVEAGRLTELWLAATVARLDALLASGRQHLVVGELEALVARHPLREELWARYLHALYLAGRQGDALAAYSQAHALLSDTLGIDPGPALQQMHARVLRQDPDLQTTAPSGAATPLPARLSSFVGRADDVRRGVELLAERRLVTLTGSGGVGKTSLAIEIARVRAETTAAVWVAELGTTTEPSRVADVVHAAVVGPSRTTPGRGEHRSTAQRVIDHIGRTDALLVVDNCEHLREACAAGVEQLLSWCPNLRVLATSREPLGVAGETVLVTAPLPLAGGPASPAVTLFVDRARSADPTGALDGEQLDAVCRVVARLDGLPLALELAAAQLGIMTIDELEQRLDTQLRAPAGSTRPSRQRTLDATIAWSYDLLSEPQRQAFGALSVCAGGWTLGTAEHLLGDDAVGLLGALVRKSLVTRVERPHHRYDMLGPVRAFAGAQLSREARSEAHERHARWCLTFATDADRHLRGPQREPWMARLEAELENLRVALDWAASNDAELAVRLAGTLGWFWFAAGHHAEGHARLEEALAVGRDLAPQLRLNATRWAVALSWHHTDPAAAIDRARRAETLAAELGDDDAVMLSQAIQAVLLHRSGDHDRAAAARAASLAMAADRRSWEAGYVQLMAGMTAIAGGDAAAAVTHGGEALARFRASGDPWAIAHTLALAGSAERRRGEADQARALLAEAWELLADAPVSRGAVDVLLELGTLAIERGDLDEADQRLRRAADVAPRAGPGAHAAALRGLAALAVSRGDEAAAGRLRDRAEALADRRHAHDVISQVRDDISTATADG